jgi:hypothetical protein
MTVYKRKETLMQGNQKVKQKNISNPYGFPD